MKVGIITVSVLILIFLMLIPNVALAGHENPLQFSFYPHEVRFFKVKPDTDIVKMITETTDTPTVKGMHIYLGGINHEDAQKLKNKGPIKLLNAIDRIYTIYVNTKQDETNPFSLEDFRKAFLRNIVDRFELASNIPSSEPLFIPITEYHSEYRYLVDLDKMFREEWRYDERLVNSVLGDYLRISGAKIVNGKIKSRNGDDITIRIALPSGDETARRIANYVVEKLEKMGFNTTLLSYSGGQDEYHIAIRRYEYQDLTLNSLKNVNGIYIGLERYKGIYLASYIYGSVVREYSRLFYGDALDEITYAKLLREFILKGVEDSAEQPVIMTYEYYLYNDDYDQGIENMARSPLTGPFSDVFYRTVKLKLFPWNGWLLVGLDEDRETAYNPVLGFNDKWGRNLWMMLSDPAVLLQPYNNSIEPNRVVWVSVETSKDDGIDVPADALTISLDKQAFVKVGEGRKAGSMVLYRLLFSHFHHGEYMSLADILYSYYFLKEWTTKSSEEDKAYDPTLASTIGEQIQDLIGFRVIKIVKEEIVIPGSFNGTKLVPWVEVYLDYTAPDKHEVIARIPPWTSIPWELLALMEEVVKSGEAAFSKEEAERKGVVWLDLTRGPSLEILEKKLRELSEKNYIPPPLREFITEEEAARRWTALKKWYEENGHFLITNGPYFLSKTNKTTDILIVTRLPTYPLGVGSYDHLSIPRYTRIVSVLVGNRTFENGGSIEVSNGVSVLVDVEVEEIRKFARNFTKVWSKSHMADILYYVLDEEGQQLITLGYADKEEEKGRFRISLENLPPGDYLLNIVSTARTKYFSQPEVVNMMNPDHIQVKLTILGKETEESIITSGEMTTKKEEANPWFNNNYFMITSSLLVVFLAAVLLLMAFSRARRR